MPINPNNRRPVYLPNNGGVWVSAPATAQTENQEPVTNPNISSDGEASEVRVEPSVYRQFAPNAQPIQLTSERANESDELMHEIYEIDKISFAETDPYDSYEDFRSLINRNQLSTYAVKGDNGELLGYYQLEPIKDGDLYIDSIGLKPEYRNSRKGYQAIKYSWNKIIDYAKENNVQTLSLHVDKTNRNLVRMYQSLGFTVKETLENYYENGAGAYFMERPVVENAQTQNLSEEVENNSTNSDEVTETNANVDEVATDAIENNHNQELASDVENEVTNDNGVNSQVPVVSEEEQQKIETERKCNEAREELQELGVDEKKTKRILKVCCKPDEQGLMIFSDDAFTCCKYLLQLEKTYNANNQDTTDEKFSVHEMQNIISSLSEEDSNGNSVIRTDLLPYLNSFASFDFDSYSLTRLLNAAKINANDDNRYISKEVLDYEKSLLLSGVKANDVDSIVRACILHKKEGDVLDKDAKFNMQMLLNQEDRMYIGDYMECAKKKDEYGFETFDGELLTKLRNHINSDNYRKKFILTAYSANKLKRAGVDLDAYLKWGKFIEDSKIAKNVSYDKEDEFKARLFNACCYKTTPVGELEVVTVFDNAVLNKAEELIANNSPLTLNLTDLPKILEACKEQQDEYSGYRFNPDLLKNFEKLKEEFPFKTIKELVAIVEACKLKETSILSDYKKTTSIKFSDEVFNTVLENAKRTGKNINVSAMEAAKEARDGKEYFNNDVYELTQNSWWDDTKDYTGNYREPHLTNFLKTDRLGNKTFDARLYQKYMALGCHLDTVSTKSKDNSGAYVREIYTPSERMMDAYKQLKEGNYPFTKRSDDFNMKGNGIDYLIGACLDSDFWYSTTYNPEAFNAVIELLDEGYDGRDVLEFILSCKPYLNHSQYFDSKRYNLAKSLIENENIDLISAGRIVADCALNGKINQQKIDKCVELYNLGDKNPTYSLFSYVKDDKIAYERLKDCLAKGFPSVLIENCKDNEKFKDRLYRMALSLQEYEFTPTQISALMSVCHTKKEASDYDSEKIFNYEMFSHIKDLVEMGIDKGNIIGILSACNMDGHKYNPEAYDKISILHNMGIDDNGIIEFISICNSRDEFNQERCDYLLGQLANIDVLRDLGHDDAYIIEKLKDLQTAVEDTIKFFGQDVVDNVLTQRIDGYVSFVKLCSNISKNCSEGFINTLQEKLAQLPSPELKVKRLRVIGGLVGKVDEQSLLTLVNRIKSPKMSAEQVQLANDIFTSDDDYETQVQKFMAAINVPVKNKQFVYDYLMREKLNKQINRPEPIDEQMAQMDIYAQQMLTNPRIPLDKKLKYIEEFKAKKADMEANPEKYTTPKMFPKPLNKLGKVVTAYVNIPNDDFLFNNSITNTMYSNIGINCDANLLSEIHYDAKYFDKLFSATSDFNRNFKRLIELKQANPNQPLAKIRMEMPEQGSELYEKYEQNGLLEQIKANLDTKRQMQEQGIDFEKWNSFNPELKSEDFSVEADPETEYKNIRYNLINIFQDELFEKINPAETDKLKAFLSERGYVLWNNKIFKDRKELEDKQIETFVSLVKDYTATNEYWKSVTNNNELSEDEILGIAGFKDHLNGIAIRIEQVKASRTVNNIHFRLTDDSDIGRNIFFGNHVSCCNSVDSTYAGYSAPMHLLNAYNRGLELVDQFGNSYGNSLCFFAMIDGKLTFVIDSFEANGKLGSNPLVTDELIKFAKKVCKEVGRSDAQVMIGPNYNNIDKTRLHSLNVNSIDVLGSVSEKTYCDSVGGIVKDDINYGVKNRSMYIYQ